MIDSNTATNIVVGTCESVALGGENLNTEDR